MNLLPIEIINIIDDYVNQLNVTEKFSKCIEQINDLNVFAIAVCHNCRIIKVYKDISPLENTLICTHNFYLSKQYYKNKDNSNFLNCNPFNFYCSICKIYDIFFRHLHYN